MKIRIRKEFSFETAHALHNYDGACRNIHGHSYRLLVSFLGLIRQTENHSKDGMVIDFTVLKKLIQETVVEKFDHSLLVKKSSHWTEKSFPEGFRVHFLDYQPTCENMLVDIVKQLQVVAPNGIELIEAELFETATSSAVWKREDNE